MAVWEAAEGVRQPPALQELPARMRPRSRLQQDSSRSARALDVQLYSIGLGCFGIRGLVTRSHTFQSPCSTRCRFGQVHVSNCVPCTYLSLAEIYALLRASEALERACVK